MRLEARPCGTLDANMLGPILFASSLVAATPAFAADPKSDAHVLLLRWLDAQNTGNFADYQALYAPSFTGVRRSGARTASFDRAGWMADRERMFRKPMTVSAEKVRIIADVASARVIFVQRWASGGYSDVGPKELVLRRGPGGFGIAREELFASATGKSGEVDLEAFRRFAFVVDGEVVVSQNPDDGWASGPPVREKQGADHLLLRMRRPVDVAKLPPALARLAGMPIRLLNSAGELCQAKLGAFQLRGREITDGFETADDLEAWAAAAHLLVAKVDGDRRACAGATWARAAELPVPVVTPAAAPSKEIRKVALAAFAALPESQNIQKDFDDWYRREHAAAPKPPRWFAYERKAPWVRVLRSGPKGPTFVSVSKSVNEGGCDDGVRAAVWGLWELQGDAAHPQLVLRNAPEGQMTLAPTGTVDTDGDGRVGILFDDASNFELPNALGQPNFIERGIVRLLDGLYLDVFGPTTPILICPC
jgi:hypothetical protein